MKISIIKTSKEFPCSWCGDLARYKNDGGKVACPAHLKALQKPLKEGLTYTVKEIMK